MKVGFSYLAAVIHKRPEDNLENFYINRFGRKLYSMFFEYYTENLWGRHPREIDASWGAQRVKGLSIVAIIKDIFGKTYDVKEFYEEHYKDDDMYKTVIGITRDENNIDKIKSLYSDNISIEEYYVSNELLNEKQNEYDMMLANTDDLYEVKEVVDNILNLYREDDAIRLVLVD